MEGQLLILLGSDQFQIVRELDLVPVHWLTAFVLV